MTYSIKAAGKTGQIYLYEEVGGGIFGGVTAKTFQQDLSALGKIETIDLFINSPGGDVFDGQAIASQLRRHSATVNVQIDGIAASIASVIAMSGDTVTIADGGLFMIHQASTFTGGNAQEMRETADVLDKIDGQLAEVYTQRTGRAMDEIVAMMAAETWFTAQEAVDNGFADEVRDSPRMAACFDFSRFRHVPEALKAESNATVAEERDRQISEMKRLAMVGKRR